MTTTKYTLNGGFKPTEGRITFGTLSGAVGAAAARNHLSPTETSTLAKELKLKRGSLVI